MPARRWRPERRANRISCWATVTAKVAAKGLCAGSGVLEGAGLRVGLNKPFAGGYIVETYGDPGHGVEALQIEINRGIYMDEATLEPGAGGTVEGDIPNLSRSLMGTD